MAGKWTESEKQTYTNIRHTLEELGNRAFKTLHTEYMEFDMSSVAAFMELAEEKLAGLDIFIGGEKQEMPPASDEQGRRKFRRDQGVEFITHLTSSATRFQSLRMGFGEDYPYLPRARDAFAANLRNARINFGSLPDSIRDDMLNIAQAIETVANSRDVSRFEGIMSEQEVAQVADNLVAEAKAARSMQR